MRICRLSILVGMSALSLSACATTSGTMSKTDAALAKMADQTSALPLLERVYQKDPKNVENALKYAAGLRRAGLSQKAVAVLDPFSKSNDKEIADIILPELASAQLESARYPQAEATAQIAIKNNPSAYRMYQTLGIALDAQGKYPEAEKAFRTALEKWKGDPVPIMNNLALNLTNQERLDEALEIMKRAKTAAPDRLDVERNLRIIRTLNENASGRPAPKPVAKPTDIQTQLNKSAE